MKTRLVLIVISSLLAAPALADGELHVYNWSDYIADDTIAKFEAETGTKVVYDVYDSNEILETKMLAGQSGYDIVVPTAQFLKNTIAAGAFRPLDPSKLPNLKNMDPELMRLAAQNDPDNAHSVIYMWGTTGIGYNVAKVKERLGEDAPVDSWSLIFDPENAAKLADCGITLPDSPGPVLPVALTYLGFDVASTGPESMETAAEAVRAIRPHIRYFHSSQFISDLANGEVCVSLGASGDMFIAADRARQAGEGVEIAYSIPKEGAEVWFDMLAIPADAPNPDAAHDWINFIMDPQISADITNFVYYANVNRAATPLVDPEITGNPSIYPSPEVQANLFTIPNYGPENYRRMTRLWTQLKAGQD